MNIILLLCTICHLRPIQIVYQVLYRLYKSQYKEIDAPAQTVEKRLSAIPTSREYIERYALGIQSQLYGLVEPTRYVCRRRKSLDKSIYQGNTNNPYRF